MGESAIAAGLWMRLDDSVYRRIHNVIVPAQNGTTQIDHVLVSVFGIFVVETKDRDGWIYGAPDQPKWTQVQHGKKYQFQNPLRQNYRHTKCLSEYLGLDHDLFHSVVIFTGESEFKTPMPENVLDRGLSRYITSFVERLLTEKQVEEIATTLRSLKESSGLSKSDHLDSLRERHGSTTTCPRCGGSLVERTAKQGAHAGQSFLGCSNYPRCRFTRAV